MRYPICFLVSVFFFFAAPLSFADSNDSDITPDKIHHEAVSVFASDKFKHAMQQQIIYSNKIMNKNPEQAANLVDAYVTILTSEKTAAVLSDFLKEDRGSHCANSSDVKACHEKYFKKIKSDMTQNPTSVLKRLRNSEAYRKDIDSLSTDKEVAYKLSAVSPVNPHNATTGATATPRCAGSNPQYCIGNPCFTLNVLYGASQLGVSVASLIDMIPGADIASVALQIILALGGAIIYDVGAWGYHCTMYSPSNSLGAGFQMFM